MKKYKLLFLILFVNYGITNLFSQTSKTYHLIVGLEYINDSNYSARHNRTYDQKATSGVPNDIFKMKRIAERNDHIITTLTNEKATVKNVMSEIISIGKQIKKDDTFFLYFTGHGDVIKDVNGDEESGYDQVLVLYDDFLLDDDIYTLLTNYFTTTKNIMVVDACHSSTSYKYAKYFLDFKFKKAGSNKFLNEKNAIQQNYLDESGICVFENKIDIDEPFNLIYFGATEDENTALGNINGGLLTYYLDIVINKAISVGNWNTYTYLKLACELNYYMQSEKQNLQYHEIGKTVSTYTNQTPFKSF